MLAMDFICLSKGRFSGFHCSTSDSIRQYRACHRTIFVSPNDLPMQDPFPLPRDGKHGMHIISSLPRYLFHRRQGAQISSSISKLPQEKTAQQSWLRHCTVNTGIATNTVQATSNVISMVLLIVDNSDALGNWRTQQNFHSERESGYPT